MSTRVWTKEELDTVHPLPEGDEPGYTWWWRWEIGTDGSPVAVGWYDDNDGISGEHRVFVWHGALQSICSDHAVPPPHDVALSVTLAAKGLDSFATVAAKLTEWSEMAAREADTHPSRYRFIRCEGQAHAWREAAEMVRRGRVKP